MNTLKSILSLALLGVFLLVSCVKTDFDEPPAQTPEAVEVNTTIADLAAMHVSGAFEALSGDMAIEGKVISSDESGNFYKELFIQDATGGIVLSIDVTNLFTAYPVGRTVYVKLDGLTLGDDNGSLTIGGGTYIDDGEERLERISDVMAGEAIIKGVINETANPTVKTIDQLTDGDINTLVRLEDVQFIDADAGQTYADGDTQFDLNRTIEDCDGNEVIIRSSGYSNFANALTPTGNGTITAVLSVYQSTKQLYIRDLSDISMEETRCDGSGGGGNGGGGNTGEEIINESFDGTTQYDVLNLDGWYNIAEVGSDDERWFANEYNEDPYAQVTAYQSVDAENILWLITPEIDLSEETFFTFNANKSFWEHDGLSVWIANDFDGSDTESTNWESISCILPSENNDNYEWVNSGTIRLNDYFSSGTVNIGFRYEGSASNDLTTTYQVDNIRVYTE